MPQTDVAICEATRTARSGGSTLPRVGRVAMIACASPDGRAKPGRYHVGGVSADPLPSGDTSRRWEVGIKLDDGSIVIERDPWP
jgi:hypothetical protein